jgi:cytochrome c oxidase subunit 2
MASRRLLLPAAAAPLLAGCEGVQSALVPAGPAARSINELGLGMTIGAVVVALLVLLLMLLPLGRRATPVEAQATPQEPAGEAAPRARRRQRLFLWLGGVLLPAGTLTVLLPFVFATGQSMRMATGATQPSITVTGHQYWWSVSYRRADGLTPVTTANELRIPVGEPVEILLEARDVIHSFWVPSLAGKTDLIPGRTNRMVIQADRPGVYRGQCAEYCGLQHAQMAFYVIAEERADYDRWLARAARPARAPETPETERGRALFVELGCGTCHTVRGVSDGQLGPDLSQVGARRSIGAGLLPGGVGNIAAWIASTQQLKPGADMPSYDRLPGPDLRALAAYLAALE